MKVLLGLDLTEVDRVAGVLEHARDAVDLGQVETEQDFHGVTSARRTVRSADAEGSDLPFDRSPRARPRERRRLACAAPAWSARASRRSRGFPGGWGATWPCRSRPGSLRSWRGRSPCGGRPSED